VSLPFPNLPKRALKAHLFPALKGQALLSISTFCDEGCTATFTDTTDKITHTGRLVLEGARVPPGLWAINLLQQSEGQHQELAAYTGHITTSAIKFLHAACFSPTTATWTQAIDWGFFKSILVLTAKAVQRHLPKSIATVMGHLDQLRKNLHSTRHHTRPNDKEVQQFNQDVNPDNKSTTNQAFAATIDLYADDAPEGSSYLDLTGQFPS
jgi:hypothetical protein